MKIGASKLSPREALVVLSCFVGVNGAALLQHTRVLGVEVSPQMLIIPSLVGLWFGALFVRLSRFRAQQVEWLRKLERREQTITDLNRRLEIKVEARTRALQEKEIELRQSQKMEVIGRMAGGLAHDFNNLLTSLVGGLGLLRCSLSAEDKEATGIIDEMEHATERATMLTRQLLTLSRKPVTEPEALWPEEVVEGTLPMLRRLLPEDITITTHHEFKSRAQRIFMDRTQLEQVVLNLAINARDAMPHGGRIDITLRGARPVGSEHDDPLPVLGCVIEVRDTGEGMDEATRLKVFEPFFTTKPEGKGTGLGLSVVSDIVAAAEGYISVSSELGRGTCFTVRLPGTLTAVEETLPLIDLTRAPGGDEIVLVVEDDLGVRRLIQRMLTPLGYHITLAEDAEAARAILPSLPEIDLLLSDLIMPSENGPEVARQVRGARPDISVLFMTGYPGEELKDRFGDELEGRVLRKPFNQRQLAVAVRACLDERGPSRRARSSR